MTADFALDEGKRAGEDAGVTDPRLAAGYVEVLRNGHGSKKSSLRMIKPSLKVMRAAVRHVPMGSLQSRS